jgi:2-polyprenyl-3-methyl-5-hydroxy-6-metoxy-1,4-benzoquinol methylase
MASIVDDRGYNQVFVPSRAMEVRTQRRVQAMLDEMNTQSCRRILELGCGLGEASHLMALQTTADVLGVDLCESFIETAQAQRRLPNLRFAVMDLLKEDLASQVGGLFDYIVGNGILHHLRADLPAVLIRLKKILAPKGRLIFWEPNLANPYVFLTFKIKVLRRLTRLEPSEMAFTREELKSIFQCAGFTEVKSSCRDFLVPKTPRLFIKPVVWLGALLERIPCLSWLAQSIFIVSGEE